MFVIESILGLILTVIILLVQFIGPKIRRLTTRMRYSRNG